MQTKVGDHLVGAVHCAAPKHSDFFVYLNCDGLAAQDGVALAGQLGRLDLVSAILTVLGIMLGVAALYSFFHIQAKATKIAKVQAKELVESELPDIARNLFDNEIRPILLGKMMEDEGLKEEAADQIAMAQPSEGATE